MRVLLNFNILPSMAAYYCAFFNICKQKFTRIEKLTAVLLSYIVSYIIFTISGTEVFINIAVTLILAALAYRKNKIPLLSAFFALVAAIIVMVSSNITTVIFTNIFDGLLEEIPADYLSICLSGFMFLLIFIISKVFGNYFNKKLNELTDDIKEKFASYIIWEAVLTLLLFYVNEFIYKMTDNKALIEAINTLLISAYFVFLVVAVYAFMAGIKSRVDAEHNRELLESFASYATHLESLHDEMRTFRHDYINMLTPVYGYIEKSDMDGVKKYFNKYISQYNLNKSDSSLDRLKYIHIPELKGFLSLKLICAQEMKINIVIDIGEKIETIPFDLVNLCRILGIILDNAIEECSKNSPSTLKFGIIRRGPDILFVVINTLNSAPVLSKIFEKGYSTKGKGRGLGLYNVSQLIARHENISLSTEIERDEFIQRITIIP